MKTNGRYLLAGCFAVVITFSTPVAALDLAMGGTGLSLGDSRQIRGLRINLIDYRLEQVTGVNLTLLTSRRPSRGEVKGLAIGLAPGLRRLRGVGFGLVSFGAKDARGLFLGGIGAAVTGSMRGASIAGVGTSVGKDLGRALSRYDRRQRRWRLPRPGTRRNRHVRGRGCQGRRCRWCGYGCGRKLPRHPVSGGAVSVRESLQGIAVGGEVTAKRVSGLTVGLLNGVSLASFEFRPVNELHNGVAIGGFNFSRQLEGVQIGLLNYAGNNPKWARLLPVINVHR